METTFNPNRGAFLATIAWSEIGAELLAETDAGYNVMCGSTPGNPLLFPTLPDGSPDYSDHPRVLNAALDSTAAGRYQCLEGNFDYYRATLGLTDFGHASQDAIALQQIKECRALPDVDAGAFGAAVAAVAHIWASFPGSPYGQPTHTLDELQAVYVAAGGTTLA